MSSITGYVVPDGEAMSETDELKIRVGMLEARADLMHQTLESVVAMLHRKNGALPQEWLERVYKACPQSLTNKELDDLAEKQQRATLAQAKPCA